MVGCILTIGIAGVDNSVFLLHVFNDTADESSSPVRGCVDGDKLVGTGRSHCKSVRKTDVYVGVSDSNDCVQNGN
jgi:hypothetical protein